MSRADTYIITTTAVELAARALGGAIMSHAKPKELVTREGAAVLNRFLRLAGLLPGLGMPPPPAPMAADEAHKLQAIAADWAAIEAQQAEFRARARDLILGALSRMELEGFGRLGTGELMPVASMMWEGQHAQQAFDAGKGDMADADWGRNCPMVLASAPFRRWLSALPETAVKSPDAPVGQKAGQPKMITAMQAIAWIVLRDPGVFEPRDTPMTDVMVDLMRAQIGEKGLPAFDAANALRSACAAGPVAAHTVAAPCTLAALPASAWGALEVRTPHGSGTYEVFPLPCNENDKPVPVLFSTESVLACWQEGFKEQRSQAEMELASTAHEPADEAPAGWIWLGDARRLLAFGDASTRRPEGMAASDALAVLAGAGRRLLVALQAAPDGTARGSRANWRTRHVGREIRRLTQDDFAESGLEIDGASYVAPTGIEGAGPWAEWHDGGARCWARVMVPVAWAKRLSKKSGSLEVATVVMKRLMARGLKYEDAIETCMREADCTKAIAEAAKVAAQGGERRQGRQKARRG